MLRTSVLLGLVACVAVTTAQGDEAEANPAEKYSEDANTDVEEGSMIAKNCDEQDIFAEGNSFNLDQADIEDCTHINLWNVNIGDNGTVAIVEAIMQFGEDNTVYRMDLGFNHISDEGAIALAKLLEQPYCRVEWLNIHGNPEIGVAGFEALANALGRNKELLSLDMGNNEMDAEQGAAFAKGIENNVGLKELWLNTNKLGPAGGASVLLALSKNTGIVKILLGGNAFGDAQVRIPAEALLSNNRVLEELDIGNNEIGDETAKFLAKGLAKNNALEILDLDSNHITEVGAREIVGALEKNLALKKLWFTSIKIKDDKLRKALQAVAEEENPTIRKVNARRLAKGGK